MSLNAGICRDRRVFYPYERNCYRQRTHNEFKSCARAAENRSSKKKTKNTSVGGIKGTSPLVQIFEYPKQVILDYMHLCCLGHMSTLIHRWLPMLSTDALMKINSSLLSQRFPNDMSVKFNYPLQCSADWKAKHFRVFLLHIGLPLVLWHLPPNVASHFSFYSLFVKLLHCPESHDEIVLADKIIHLYCKTAPAVYDETIEIYSLHAHLHLPQQVLNHGGLCFTSAFCFESAIRYLKQKAHGTRDLGRQIGEWIEIEKSTQLAPLEIPGPTGMNKVRFDSSLLDKYRMDLQRALNQLQMNLNGVILFLRFKDTFITYHSVLYDLPFGCESHIVSFSSPTSSTEYGHVIVFVGYNEHYYALIQKYQPNNASISDHLSLPAEIKRKMNDLFPIRILTQSFILVSTKKIRHKCIKIESHNMTFLSEIRADYEHD